jgi:hypothetical protein
LNRSRSVAAEMQRFRAGAAIDSPGWRSGAVMKEHEARPQREKDHADDEEERKRASHAVNRYIGCGLAVRNSNEKRRSVPRPLASPEFVAILGICSRA